MFQDFQRKFRQRLNNVMIAGAIWVANTATTGMLLRLVGTYVPPPSGAPITSDILQLSRTSVGAYRLFFCPERTDRGLVIDWGPAAPAIGSVSTGLNLGTSGQILNLQCGVQLVAGTSNLAIDINAACGVLTIGNAAGAPNTDVTTGTTELRSKTACATATTNIAGGTLLLRAGNGASSSAGAAHGGNVRICGGTKFGTGTPGAVQLGYDGTGVCRVTVRNTILGLNGYTSSAADPTTTELATAGDYGIHKNTTSGTVFLAFNDAGTIRKVALA